MIDLGLVVVLVQPTPGVISLDNRYFQCDAMGIVYAAVYRVSPHWYRDIRPSNEGHKLFVLRDAVKQAAKEHRL